MMCRTQKKDPNLGGTAKFVGDKANGDYKDLATPALLAFGDELK